MKTVVVCLLNVAKRGWPSSFVECRFPGGNGAVSAEAEHGTDHLGVKIIPAVVTNNRIIVSLLKAQ